MIGVVDDDVDHAEFPDRPTHHRFDRIGPAHVGGVVARLHAVLGSDLRAQPLDLVGGTESVEDHVAAARGERFRDALTDTARGAGDEGRSSLEHICLPSL